MREQMLGRRARRQRPKTFRRPAISLAEPQSLEVVVDGSTPVIDASVHVLFPTNADLRGYLREPFKSRGFPDYEMDWYGYGAPDGEYSPAATARDGEYPASDVELVAQQLFDERGVDVAVLHPMGRGNIPDRHLHTALCAATNEMLVERWLESAQFGDRFRGTIRVNVEDVEGAVKEIRR